MKYLREHCAGCNTLVHAVSACDSGNADVLRVAYVNILQTLVFYRFVILHGKSFCAYYHCSF